jgi:hypothetical protein
MKIQQSSIPTILVMAMLLVVLLPVIPAHAASLVVNSGFENGSGTTATGWTQGTDYTRSSDQAQSGTYSLKGVYTGSSVITTQTTGFDGYNQTFYIVYWIYRTNSTGNAYLSLWNTAQEEKFYASSTTGSWIRVVGSAEISDTSVLNISLGTESTNAATYFDNVCVSLTLADCPANTPTPSSTHTPTTTSTPTSTFTPTATGSTPTPTITVTPWPSITWADGPVTLSAALLEAIETLLTAEPVAEAESNIYAVTNISGIDTSWNISIVNLVDVASPYTDWDQMTNVVWAWFVNCVGDEPTWSCTYYELPSGGGDGTLRFPWKTGYAAKYGVMGVHAGAQMIPGSSAVDFFGSDALGANVMPPQAVAVADGTITSVCSDGTSMAIRVDGGPIAVAYFHFDTGQTFVEGQTIQQGQVLGQLKHGTFTGSNCGYGVQGAEQFHLHFVWLPTSPGFLEIGGCVLNISTSAFVCGADTYRTLTLIPNGGGTSNPDNPTVPGDGAVSGGGVHIWDGIVAAIVELNTSTISQYLPEQNPIFGYIVQKVTLVVDALMAIFLSVWTAGYSGVFLLNAIIGIIGLELAYLGAALLFGIGRIFL